MELTNLSAILAMATPSQPGQPPPPFWTSLVPIGLLILVFYFALIRPQQKKAKQQEELLKSVRPGDKIITSTGIMGAVITVKEKSITIRSADSKLEITKSAIGEIVERGGDSNEA